MDDLRPPVPARPTPPHVAEQMLLDEIARRRDDLIALLTDLIAFDTTARDHLNDPARDEAALQAYLAARLRAAGAEIDLWEPAPEDVAGSPMAPPGLRFDGRPQLAARFAGTGGGRSLLFNGHIDVVTCEPRDNWTSDPRRAEVRDGLLYGRGSCDMKGGVAAMVVAAEALAALGLSLAGDLLLCTVTDEESTGAGGLAAATHGVRADAAIVPEPSNLAVWVACRGSLIPTITVAGRAGHAGIPQPDWRAGGAVNAIEKAALVMEALRGFETEWRGRVDQRHPYLAPGEVVPTIIAGGEWIVSYPTSCRLVCHIAYLPVDADTDGWGSAVKHDFETWVSRAAEQDSWLSEHPPLVTWAPEVPSSEVPDDAPIVRAALAALAATGRPPRVGGLDNWFDGATFTRWGTPSIALGPGQIERAHTVDEYVPVDDLVACAQALALTALRFCGERR